MTHDELTILRNLFKEIAWEIYKAPEQREQLKDFLRRIEGNLNS